MAGDPTEDEELRQRRQLPSQRLDKWLWFSRMLKSRTLAAQLVERGQGARQPRPRGQAQPDRTARRRADDRAARPGADSEGAGRRAAAWPAGGSTAALRGGRAWAWRTSRAPPKREPSARRANATRRTVHRLKSRWRSYARTCILRAASPSVATDGHPIDCPAFRATVVLERQ